MIKLHHAYKKGQLSRDEWLVLIIAALVLMFVILYIIFGVVLKNVGLY